MSKYTTDELVEFINDFSQFHKKISKNICDFMFSVVSDIKVIEIEEIKKKYGILNKDKFNIFKSLEKYQHEIFNEIILLNILNPNTNEIGNKKYLDMFCDLLTELGKKPLPKFSDEVVVKRQQGDGDSWIDILIYDDKNAIIIESKINNAEDQDKQLFRYLKFVKERLERKDNVEREVTAIVYIRPVDNENKEVDWKKYKYTAKEKKEVEKHNLVYLSVVNKERKDLCHGFLDKCVDYINKNDIIADETAKVYIRQYSELLKLNGGNKMCDIIYEELFEKLYGDSQNFKKMKVIEEMVEKRWELLAKKIKESLCLPKNGFKISDNDKNITEKRINEKLHIVFCDYEDESWRFGFCCEDSKAIVNKIKNILNNYKNKLLGNKEAKVIDDCFIIKRIEFEIEKPIDDTVNDIIKMYKDLEEISNSLK